MSLSLSQRLMHNKSGVAAITAICCSDVGGCVHGPSVGRHAVNVNRSLAVGVEQLWEGQHGCHQPLFDLHSCWLNRGTLQC